MRQYFTCHGCDYIYTEEEMNLLDGDDFYCDTCLTHHIEEGEWDEEEGISAH